MMGSRMLAVDGMTLLVTLMAAQFGVHSIGWAMTAALQRQRRGPEVHFAVFWLALAAALGLRAAGGPADWELLVETALLLSALALHRGVMLFYRRDPPDAAYLASLAGGLALLALAQLNATPAWAVAGVSFVVAAAAADTARRFVREGRPRARWLVLSLAVALVAAALQMALRGLAALDPGVTWPPGSGQAGLAWGLTLFMLGGFFNLAQIRLIVGRVVRQLVAETHRDPLTNVANRRGFMALLSSVHRRSQEVGASFGLLMVDIDHFKRVNDSLGHAAGDAALRTLAAVLRETVRARDIVGRLGGEEFCVLLPGCDLPGATGLAERLRRAVAQRCRLTVSVGVALVDAAHEDAEAGLARADAALYEAKNAGRDRVALAPPPPRPADVAQSCPTPPETA